jgi:PAS domain S-box-containing protein
LNILYDAARTISSSLNLESVLQAVAVQTATALNCSGCALSLWYPKQGVLTTLVDYDAGRPDSTEPAGTEYNLAEYPATRAALESGRSLVLRRDDPGGDPAEQLLLAKWQAHSLFMLPLLVHDQVVGLLELIDDAGRNGYTPAEIRLAEGLAAQAAVAVENARLYEQAQQEISERRRVEEALRRSETLLESLIESLPQNIYSKDRQGRFTFANQRYCRTQGRTREEILGKTNFDLHPPELAAKYRDDDRWVMEKRQIFETVEEHESAGGQTTYVRVIKTPLYDAQGEVRGTLGIFWDITEHKRAEEALAHERDLLHALMDNIPDTIYFKDTGSRFTRINRAQAQVLGLDDQGEAIGKTDFDFFAQAHARAAYEDEQEIVRSGLPIIDKLERLQGKGRPPYWASVTKVPILDQDRQVVGIVGISRDISDRRRTEEELRQSMAELQNLQHITNALLSLEELGQVMGSVAEGIVTHLGYDMVLVSRYVEQNEAFIGMALHPLPGLDKFEKLLRLLGYPELMEDPTNFQVAYHRGENPTLDRVLDGETVISAEMVDLFQPWVNHVAAAAAQKMVGIKTFINTPMRVKDRTVGTIVAGVRAPTIASSQQQALIRVASQAAVAVENARLFEAEHQRAAELERSNAFITALSQVAARIEATPDPDRVLETLGSELRQLGITCFLALMEPGGQAMIGRYSSIESRVLDLAEKMAGVTLSDFRIPQERWPMQQVIIQGQAQYVPDLISATARLLPQIPKRVLAQIMRRVDVRPGQGAIYLPLKVKDQVLGIMTVWGCDLEEEDAPALMVFASQVAVAFENARLYDQAQQEVAARLEVEDQIRASLAEKEILLKEIHHRVKNNLQIISSLLSLQSDHIQDPEALASFRDSQSRIRSMALIHERLYRAPDLARIDFGEYVHNLATYLFRVYGVAAQSIRLDVQARSIFLDVDTAVSCGLIVNELISNSLKHAFAPGQKGQINVRLNQPGRGPMTIEVADDGVGLPPDIDIRTRDSLGLQLVRTLVDQLDGTMKVNGQGGTVFRIEFAVSRNRG